MIKPVTSQYKGRCKCQVGVLMQGQDGNIYCTACAHDSAYRKIEQAIKNQK